MRFNEIGYLGRTEYTKDKYKNQIATKKWRKVYLNKYKDNLALQQQAAVNDHRKRGQYEIMERDYHGEKLLRIAEEIYTIAMVSDKGERLVLSVEMEMGNSE